MLCGSKLAGWRATRGDSCSNGSGPSPPPVTYSVDRCSRFSSFRGNAHAWGRWPPVVISSCRVLEAVTQYNLYARKHCDDPEVPARQPNPPGPGPQRVCHRRRPPSLRERLGASALMLKAIAEQHSWEHGKHRHLSRVASRLLGKPATVTSTAGTKWPLPSTATSTRTRRPLRTSTTL